MGEKRENSDREMETLNNIQKKKKIPMGILE